MLDFKSICALARCNRSLNSDAHSRFALATQERSFLGSDMEAPEMYFNALGLLQYHPDLHLWGLWRSLKKIPHPVLHNAVNLEIYGHLDLAIGLDEALISSKRLRDLTLSDGPIKNMAARLFKALGERESGSPGLRTLCLRWKTFGKEAMDALATYLASASSLEELAFIYCVFNNNCLDDLVAGLVQNRTIRSLDLKGSNLGDNAELTLSKILRGCPALLTLTLSSTSTRIRGWKMKEVVTAIMDDSCNLRSLNIGSLGLSDGDIVELSPVITKLHKLDIHNNSVGGDGIRAIAEALKTSKTITHIGLNDNRLIMEDVEFLSAGLAANKSLQVLELNACSIRPPELRYLKDALVGKVAMRILNLCNNSINNRGCQYVAEILTGCPSLEILQLYWNGIESAGIRTISPALPTARHLQQLTLTCNGAVDDPSAAALFAAVHGHPSLTELDISVTGCGFHIGELAKPMFERLKPGLVRKH
jgi:Ran GTPase-activating protein (RanGAP) involved in mRNA processing and transport